MFFITGSFVRMNQKIYIELLAQCMAHCSNSKLTAIAVAMLPPPMSIHCKDAMKLPDSLSSLS